MLFSPKINIICFQIWGRFGVRLASFGTDISQRRVFSHRLLLVMRIFSATFLAIRPHLIHSHNQKPYNGQYQDLNLAPFAHVGFWRFLGVFLSQVQFF